MVSSTYTTIQTNLVTTTSETWYSLQTIHTQTTLRQTHSTHHLKGRSTQSATPVSWCTQSRTVMLDQTKQPWRYVKLGIRWGCCMTSTSTVVNVWHANHLNLQHHRKFHSSVYQLGSHGRWSLWISYKSPHHVKTISTFWWYKITSPNGPRQFNWEIKLLLLLLENSWSFSPTMDYQRYCTQTRAATLKVLFYNRRWMHLVLLSLKQQPTPYRMMEWLIGLIAHCYKCYMHMYVMRQIGRYFLHW